MKKLLIIILLFTVCTLPVLSMTITEQIQFDKLKTENENLKKKLHWMSITCSSYESDLLAIKNLALEENTLHRNSSIQLMQIYQTSSMLKYPPHMNCSER